MRNEHQTDERRSKQLHYDVMGIGLAIRGHMGDSALFHEIDQALNELDWRKLVSIQQAFDLLSEARQDLIMGSAGDTMAIERSIVMFEENLRVIAPPVKQHIA